MSLATQESLGSPIGVEPPLRLPEEAVKTAVAGGVQSGPPGTSPESTPRACGGRPPSLSVAAENDFSPSPDDHKPPLGLEGLKLSQLGSYDPSRSPLVCVSIQSRSTRFGVARAGAISPAEISKSCSAGKESKKKAFSFSGPPTVGGGDERRPLEVAKLPSYFSCSPSPSAVSPPTDKLLRLPRGKALRFFIDGEEGVNSEMKS